jgi:hypothetical protein
MLGASISETTMRPTPRWTPEPKAPVESEESKAARLADAAPAACYRVISDCHFAVQLNHFIPGVLSYLVPVF